MRHTAQKVLPIAIILSVIITAISAAGVISLVIKDSQLNQGPLPQICMRGSTTFNGGYPMAWIHDQSSFCGRYVDILSYSITGFIADAVVWFLLTLVVLVLILRPRKAKRKVR